ncbi:hypothetical protein MNBD_GAMMA03-273 [hydrothermal vent metagenome]|uniref:O-antigen ligase-related domain-containing protein n=1 Tax=hydrothermal vent metagenome TaxID=652676 RepID=A0A3B0WB25_9ZZZZ
MNLKKNNFLLYFLLSIPGVLCGLALIIGTIKDAFGILFFYGWTLLAIKNIHAAIIIFFFLIPLERNNPFFSLDELFIIKSILIFILFIVWFISKLKTYSILKNIFSDNNFTPFWILFLFLFVLSTLYSINITQSFRQLVLVISICFLYYIYCEVLQKKQIIKLSLWTLSITSAGVAVITILQYFIIRYHILSVLEPFLIPKRFQFQNILGGLTEIHKHRSYGTFSHPNLLGAYLSLCLPISFIFCLMQKKIGQRVVTYCIFILLIIALFLSNSRASILSSTVSMSYIIFSLVKQKRKILSIFAVVTIIMILSVVSYSPLSEYFSNYLRLKSKISNRELLWVGAIDIVSNNKMLGTGPATFSMAYHALHGMPAANSPDFLVEDIYESRRVGKAMHQPKLTAHNLFLQYAVNIGLFGPVLIIFFYFTYFKCIFSTLKIKNTNMFYRYLLIGTSSVVFGTLIHGIFESSIFMEQPFQSYLFIYMVSLTMICKKKIVTNINLHSLNQTIPNA